MPFYLKTKNFPFTQSMTKYAVLTGVGIGVLIFVYNKELQELFHTKPRLCDFSFGIPLYFLMSINRGLYQGQNVMDKLVLPTKPKWLLITTDHRCCFTLIFHLP
jgi:hypothetical protein